MPDYPIPDGADAQSAAAIRGLKKRFGRLRVGEPQIAFIIRTIMAAQEPRDRLRDEVSRRSQVIARRSR